MKRYNKLIKRRNKALRVFQKTRDNLSKIVDDTINEVTNVDNTVRELEEKIAEEKATKLALETHKAEVEATIKNINTILAPVDADKTDK